MGFNSGFKGLKQTAVVHFHTLFNQCLTDNRTTWSCTS